MAEQVEPPENPAVGDYWKQGRAVWDGSQWVSYIDRNMSLFRFIKEQKDWSFETFGPDYSGALPHLKKEIAEIEEHPDDLEEWIDAALLAFSGACRSGGGRSAEEVADMLVSKYLKNRRRVWPDWRTVAAGEAIEHDRTKDPA